MRIVAITMLFISVVGASTVKAAQPLRCFRLSHLLTIAAQDYPRVKAQRAQAAAIGQQKWADLLNNTQLQAGWEQDQSNGKMLFGPQSIPAQWGDRTHSFGVQVNASLSMIYKFRGMEIEKKVAESVGRALSL